MPQSSLTATSITAVDAFVKRCSKRCRIIRVISDRNAEVLRDCPSAWALIRQAQMVLSSAPKRVFETLLKWLRRELLWRSYRAIELHIGGGRQSSSQRRLLTDKTDC